MVKRAVIASGLFICMVILLGCTRLQLEPQVDPMKEEVKQVVTEVVQPEVKQLAAPAIPDCVENADCFRNYLLGCKPAIAKYEAQTTARIFEIKNQKEQFYCNVHLTTIGLNTVEEDCTAYAKQEFYGGLGYYKDQRSMAYFKVEGCTNRVVRQ